MVLPGKGFRTPASCAGSRTQFVLSFYYPASKKYKQLPAEAGMQGCSKHAALTGAGFRVKPGMTDSWYFGAGSIAP
jgi:hypothetical protein